VPPLHEVQQQRDGKESEQAESNEPVS